MRVIIFLAVFVISDMTYSQVYHSFSAGPEISLPIKNLGSRTPTSLGGSFEYQLKGENFPIGVQVHIGFNHFKDALGGKVNFTPARVGAVGFIYQDLIFIYSDVGISRFYSPTTGTKQNGFSFGGGAGYRIPIGEKQFIQLSGYYNLHNYRNNLFAQNYNYTWFNIRAAYGLSFGKKKNLDRDE